MIIVLDGSKGAGKSTTSKLLNVVLNDSIVLSLDLERGLLVNQEGKTIQARNKEAFEVLLNKCASYLDEGKTIIIDCGLLSERVIVIDKLAQDKNVMLYKFLLKAPYNTQLERVRQRDAIKGQETDENRFRNVHDSLHGKSFEDFVIIETDKNSPEEVVNIILRNVKI